MRAMVHATSLMARVFCAGARLWRMGLSNCPSLYHTHARNLSTKEKTLTLGYPPARLGALECGMQGLTGSVISRLPCLATVASTRRSRLPKNPPPLESAARRLFVRCWKE